MIASLWRETTTTAIQRHLGEYEEDFDIPGIVREISRKYGMVSLEFIPEDDLTKLIQDHAKGGE